jgi:hypothetical protein
MKTLHFVLGSLLVAALLVLMGVSLYYLYLIFEAVVAGAKQLEPSVYVPLTVTVFTAVLGLGATLYTQNRTRLREIESAHRERKLEIYLEFLKFIETALLSAKPELGGKPLDETELARKLLEFRTKAVLWGSPGVLRAVSKMTSGPPSGPLEIFDLLEKIQREMRKDIGLSNRGLEKDFFAKLPLSDPEELARMRKSASR